MTNLTLRSLDIPSIHKFAVGFDNMFDELLRATHQQPTTYPPYNVVKHTDDKFSIEVAVAGFKEDEIEVELKDNQLTVKGEKAKVEDAPQITYLHKGLSARNFTRTFTLNDHVEVRAATIENGVLAIALELVVPEEDQPKKIAITYKK